MTGREILFAAHDAVDSTASLQVHFELATTDVATVREALRSFVAGTWKLHVYLAKYTTHVYLDGRDH